MNSTSTPYKLVPFKSLHLGQMTPRQAQLAEYQWLNTIELDDDDCKLMRAFTGYKGDTLLGAAGIIPQWPGRWVGWACYTLAAANDRRTMLHIFRWTKDFLDHELRQADVRRIETTVALNFEAGHRYAKKLGFNAEGLLEKYTPSGGDCILYARISDGTNTNSVLGGHRYSDDHGIARRAGRSQSSGV